MNCFIFLKPGLFRRSAASTESRREASGEKESHPHRQLEKAKLDLTQDDLARKSGVKYTTPSKIESGVVTKPTVHIMAKIAKALDVTIDKLIK